MLSASSSNNRPLFPFGGRNGLSNATNLGDNTTGPLDFLPSVSFDDLQSSLESASTDFKLTQFPSPNGQGSILGDEEKRPDITMVERSNVTHNGGTTRVAIQQQPPATRVSRSGSILRRPSTSGTRQGSLATASAPGVGVPNAPTAPAAMRQRRQSHYPPVSNSNIAKPPRKSVGPGILDGGDYDTTRTGQRRRPSFASLSERTGAESTRSSIDGGSRPMNERTLTGSRAAKARSVQPPPRANHSSLSTADNSTLTVDSSTPSFSFPRSPRTSSTQPRNANAPSSGRRVSVMPGVTHTSHATGLGARTISPTDTRRMKRMSIMPNTPLIPPPVSTQPLPTSDLRASSRSPSMLPRKTSTPSSSRTTPEFNRKSYSSGLSITSTNSFNTVRTSTGSLQPRSIPQNPSSRLPAPKALSFQNASGGEEEEDVPPVPAIPKVYDSPKNSPGELSFLDKTKPVLPFDTSSIHSNSTGSLSLHATDPPKKAPRKMSIRKSVNPVSKLEVDKQAAGGASSKKNLQPLQLPPLNLGPLATPTAARIAALNEHGSADRHSSPPLSRQIAKTPSTPMTASKSSFFSRHKDDDKTDPINIQLRSSSSVHHMRHDSPLAADTTSSSESVTGRTGKPRSGLSPFLSSSVPKSGTLDSSFALRSRALGDFTLPMEGRDNIAAPLRPSEPRTAKAETKSTPPLSSPDEPATPSSISSIRRKLSLSWKRSTSKSSLSFPAGEKGEHQNGVRHDSMPPPRIPVSSTVNNVGQARQPSPTSSAKSSGTGHYLESRRRKSSASSLNAIIAQDRHRSDSIAGSKKESTLDTVAERSNLSHNASVVQKILRPKASTSTIRHHDPWTAELDKDDMVAEEEMKKLGLRRKETEIAARTLDALRKRASAKERVSPQDAIRIAVLNIYERGEIVDYKDIYFCGTQNAAKVVGDVQSSSPNFGYDDERGDYSIIPGDHLSYRYEIIDILGKGSFGQVVRCIDHKTGVLVAVKIIRNKKRFHQQALVEVNILQKLREWVRRLPSNPELDHPFVAC